MTTTTKATMIRRFKPAASFSPLGRVVHEIRLWDDGVAEYLVQPTLVDEAFGHAHSSIKFGSYNAADFSAAVASGQLIEVLATE